MSSCGPGCTETDGHDYRPHEAAGRDAVYAELEAKAEGLVRTGALVVELGRELITLDGRPFGARGYERGVLRYLARNLGAACTSFEIVAAVWDTTTAELWTAREKNGGARALRIRIVRLRRHLGAHRDLIETIKFYGYRLRAERPPEDV